MLRSFFILSALLVGCASSSSSTTEPGEVAASEISAASNLFRGSVVLDGATYLIDVEMTIDQVSKQVRSCIAYEGEAPYAFLSQEPVSGGLTVRTVVRDVKGAVLGETSTKDTVSTLKEIDAKATCTAKGKVTDRAPVDTQELSELVWINGLKVAVPGGPIWVNNGYGEPGREFASLKGTIQYKQTEVVGTSVPVGFAGGERVTTGRGTHTIDIQKVGVGEDASWSNDITLDIGFGSQGGHFEHPVRREKIVLRRQ